MEEVLSYSLSYGDELWHVMLYQWLIDNALTDRLLEVKLLLFLINNPLLLTPEDDFHSGCGNISPQTTALFKIILTWMITQDELNLLLKLNLLILHT